MGSLPDAFCIRSNSCFEYGGLRVNCSFGGGLLRGFRVRSFEVCTKMRGLFAVAGCPLCSPRIDSGILFSENISNF